MEHRRHCQNETVSNEPADVTVRGLALVAERYDSFADTAELMGDEAGAVRFRSEASARRMVAMALLDDHSP